jgi:hypothetical protein
MPRPFCALVLITPVLAVTLRITQFPESEM